MNKIDKLDKELEKAREKAAEWQAKIRELEKQKQEEENSQIVQAVRSLKLTPDEVRLLDNRKAVLLVRGERPILDEKYDLHKHVNVKYTEDGGAPPYDYAKAPLSHEDVTIDTRRLDDYELLSAGEILGREQSF